MENGYDTIIIVIGSIITVIISNWYSLSRIRHQNKIDTIQADDIRVKQRANLEERVMAWVDRLEEMLKTSQSENVQLRAKNDNLVNENGELRTKNILLEVENKETKLDLEKCLSNIRGNNV